MFNLTLTSKVLGRSLKTSLTAGLVALSMVSGAQAADKTIKIGVVYDYTRCSSRRFERARPRR